MSDDSPALAFIVGESLAVGSATLDRKPTRSASHVRSGTIVFDAPGLYRFKRADAACYFEAVAFDPRALAMVPLNGASGGPPRDPRAALRSLVLDPRLTEALLCRTLEAEAPPHVVGPGAHVVAAPIPDNGKPGALLPFDDF